MLASALDTIGDAVDVELFLTGEHPTDGVTALHRGPDSRRVTALPHLDRVSYREFLRSLDVFVVPSDQEGLCIAALEAMACGCPVVSTRCGGPEEFVVDGETGFLVDHDPVDLGRRIVEVVSDRPMRTRLGANARQLVVDRYTQTAFETRLWHALTAVWPDAGMETAVSC
jgi:glycosyltransferase involved in cell wall biosynthesis